MDEKRIESNELKVNDLEKKDLYSKEDVNLEYSSKSLSKVLFYSTLEKYGTIPINLVITWLIAHSISTNYWGLFIYSTVLVNGSAIITGFIPPSLNSVLTYKLPGYIVNDKPKKAKGLIIYALKIKFLIGIL